MKMSYLYNFLIIFLLLSFVSCEDDNSEKLHLEQENVTVWIGQEASIKIISEVKSLSIESDDNTIATAIIKDNTIVIKANKSGKTILHLKDDLNKYATADIQVYVQTLSGGWKETETSQYKYEVTTAADNKEIANKLEQDLWESSVKLLRIIYIFNSKTQELEVIMPDGVRKNGTFLFDNEKLILNYNNNTEIYQVAFLYLGYIQLTQDLTELYKVRYPNAGISKVIVKRYIASLLT